jgi:histidinol phosphatase-like enzyme (inositol monophosphatase family)
MAMPYEKELAFARRIALESGQLSLQHQARGVEPEEKDDLSPVTIADKESEKLIVGALAREFPDDGVLGEEGTEKIGSNGRKWIIDPIDGTRDFVRGNDLWAVLIGLEVDDEVAMGVAHFPARGTTFYAVKGIGAYRDGVRLKVSSIQSVDKAVLSVNGLNNLGKRPFAPMLLTWISQFWSVRSLGGALDAMMLASGQVDVWIENTAKAWDLAPLKIIFEESGAKFYNFDGGTSIYGGDCIVCTPALESTIRQLM